MNSVQKNIQGTHSRWPGWGVVILFRLLAEALHRNIAYFASFQIQASDGLCEKRQSVLPFKHTPLCSVITSFIHTDEWDRRPQNGNCSSDVHIPQTHNKLWPNGNQTERKDNFLL